jgi:hypothetical protein
MRFSIVVFLVPLALACGYPPGFYELNALSAGDDESLTGVLARVEVEHTPAGAWDLTLLIDLDNGSPSRPLVDLSRTLLRVDGMPWRPCRLGPDARPDDLRFRLGEFERRRVVVTCQDIPRPDRSLEVRVPVSGLGTRGYVDLPFEGLRPTR